MLGLFEPLLVPVARERLHRFDRAAPLTDLEGRILLACAAYDQARTGTGRDAAAGQTLRLAGDLAIRTEDSQGAWAQVAGVLLAAGRLSTTYSASPRT